MRRSSPRHLQQPEPRSVTSRHAHGVRRFRGRYARTLVVPALVLALTGILAVTLPAGTSGAAEDRTAGLRERRAGADQSPTGLRQSQAVWSVKCDISHAASDDPIVAPGRPGAAHLHDFFGNTSVDAATDTGSLMAAGSTCLRGMDEVDKAAYWTPALLRNGRRVTGPGDEHRIDAYYAVLDTPRPLRPIPFGLRMIAGDAKATGPQPVDIVHFNCLDHPQGGQATRNSSTIPTCPPGTYLSAKINFPSCWDGTNLDSQDHKSHMAYPQGGRCPASHPVGLPTLGLRVRWKAALGVPAAQLSFSSGGRNSLHADFWNAWDPAVMRWLVDNCLNTARNCTNIDRDRILVGGVR
jgi:hypothetical protein